MAEYSRLVAERDGLEKVVYPEEWLKKPEKYKSYMDAQNKIFSERKTSYSGKINILDERINQLSSEISGIKAQIAAAQKQLQYTSSEISSVETLLANGNTTMSRLLDLKSRKSEIEGRIGELQSDVAKANQEISENKLNKINLKNETLNDVVEKIKEAQSKVDEYSQRGGAASDTLSRTEIRAPVTGIVKDMKYKTAGSSGVIPPNGEVLTIVPVADELVAEVRIAPTDIDVVRKPNLKTRVRITSYSARHIPMLDGVLRSVSADAFKDPQTQKEYYKGTVTIDTKVLKRYVENKKDVDHEALLYPGMPVEVYIVTGERSPLHYLFEPVMNDMRRSFREE
jgi:HlyD family type I secretion membrane fusion protein